jgi:hypothetical protein
MSGQIAQADTAEPAHDAYEQVLERQTGKFAPFAVAFALVSIATGIFTTYGSTLITHLPRCQLQGRLAVHRRDGRRRSGLPGRLVPAPGPVEPGYAGDAVDRRRAGPRSGA